MSRTFDGSTLMQLFYGLLSNGLFIIFFYSVVFILAAYEILQLPLLIPELTPAAATVTGKQSISETNSFL